MSGITEEQTPYDYDAETVGQVTEDRRAALPLDEIAARSGWQDRRLMALAAHKKGQGVGEDVAGIVVASQWHGVGRRHTVTGQPHHVMAGLDPAIHGGTKSQEGFALPDTPTKPKQSLDWHRFR